MAAPTDKLAESLGVLKAFQDQGRIAIRAADLSRTHRERLQANGFIRPVMKGWYIPSRPDEPQGESTSWYASFWDFSSAYLTERFGDAWCLGAEQSISLHTGDWTVPRQLLVRSPRGGNKPTQLIHDTSIFDVQLELPPPNDVSIIGGMRIYSLPAALISCAPSYFPTHASTLRAALAMVSDASEVLGRLLDGGHSKVAARLAGAFRNIGRDQIADNIVATMQSAGYTINETDPFVDPSPMPFGARETSPYVNRLRMSWMRMRADIIPIFPPAPGIATDVDAYIKQVNAAYVADAYNSLSIEGYKVSAELIERVRSGSWNPDSIKGDRDQRDALAARGYWQAFQTVGRSIEKVLDGAQAGAVADQDHATWYRELFGPSVTAGILKPSDLAGYRNGPVFIRRSMHVPPGREAVRELMPTFFELLRQEPEPAVRVVLGHFVLVYIHPYLDGNGRMGRFMMNLMLASGGYPWTIVPLERRADYMAALEAASVGQDIKPFATFLAGLIRE
ncbi:Fic family protein [Peristeroidobacter soli]|uniref:Fic family protein n=1 Tax=Peristeroidobacter soli TaxID=2497877 RepID=UPI00101C5F0D|nr:Fic family protein [Peristeroidobacter soli]